MKRVLFIPQYSMRSLTRDTWLLDRDGHFDFMLGIVHGLQRAGHALEYHMLVPDRTTEYAYVPRLYGLPEPISFIPKPFARNVAIERTNFDVAWWRSLLEPADYDLIVNNNEGWARGLYLLREFYGLRYRLHTLYDHVPIFRNTYMPYDRTAWYRIEESAACSDALFTLLEDVKPILEFFLRRPVDLVPFIEPRLLGRDVPKQDLVFLSGRLTDPTKVDGANIDRVLTIVRERGLELIVANPDESVVTHPALAPHVVQVTSKADYYALLAKAKYCPLFLNPTLTNSTTYFQAVRSFCQVRIERAWNERTLAEDAQAVFEAYSCEAHPDRLRSFVEC